MWPLELTATPATSPKYKSAGSFRNPGMERKGISGTRGCCARSELAVARNKSRAQRLIGLRIAGRNWQIITSLNAMRSNKYYDSAVGIGDGNGVTAFSYSE